MNRISAIVKIAALAPLLAGLKLCGTSQATKILTYAEPEQASYSWIIPLIIILGCIALVLFWVRLKQKIENE